MSHDEHMRAGSEALVSVEDILRQSAVPAVPRDVRDRIFAQIDRRESESRLRGTRLVFARALAVFACFSTLLGGVSYATAHSLPGDALYPLKRASQEMRVMLTPEGSRVDALIQLSDQRAEEVRLLMQQRASGSAVDRAVEGFGDAAGRAVQSAPDTQTAQQRVRRIEDAVSDEPAQVRERVQRSIPSPTPASPGTGGSGGTSGSGSGSGTSGGTSGSGSGSGTSGGTSGSGSGSTDGSGAGSGGSGSGSGAVVPGPGSSPDGSGSGTGTDGGTPVTPGRP